MADTKQWTAGVKNPFQRLLIYFAGSVIVTLCIAISVMYRQMSATIDYERGEKENVQKDLRECNATGVENAMKLVKGNEARLDTQKVYKTVLKIE